MPMLIAVRVFIRKFSGDEKQKESKSIKFCFKIKSLKANSKFSFVRTKMSNTGNPPCSGNLLFSFQNPLDFEYS